MPRLSDQKIPKRGNRALWETLQRMNWNHGRGEIVALYETTRAPLTGVAVCKLQYGRTLAIFATAAGKVRFRGRTRVIRLQREARP